MRTETESRAASARLANLAGRSSAYEIAIGTEGQTYLLAYTPRLSRSGLLSALWAFARTRPAGAINTYFNVPERDLEKQPVYEKLGYRWGVHVGPLHIRFTGRTEREALIQGELPWIAKAITSTEAPNETLRT